MRVRLKVFEVRTGTIRLIDTVSTWLAALSGKGIRD
jgi:hypothetical protein